MENKLISAILFGTVAIILIGAIMVPIINDATDGDQETYSNGGYYVDYVSDDATITVTSSAVTLDGEELSASQLFYIMGDSFYVYYYNGMYIVYSASTITLEDTDEYTITVADNTAVINDGTSDVVSFDCNGFYIGTTEETSYVISGGSSERYANSISDFYLSQIVSGVFYHLEDGILYADGVETAYTVTSGLSEVDGYEDLYLRSGGLTLTLTDSSSTVYLGYSYILPATVEGTVEDTADEGSLLLVIPVVVIIAVLMAFVSIVRKD